MSKLSFKGIMINLITILIAGGLGVLYSAYATGQTGSAALLSSFFETSVIFFLALRISFAMARVDMMEFLPLLLTLGLMTCAVVAVCGFFGVSKKTLVVLFLIPDAFIILVTSMAAFYTDEDKVNEEVKKEAEESRKRREQKYRGNNYYSGSNSDSYAGYNSNTEYNHSSDSGYNSYYSGYSSNSGYGSSESGYTNDGYSSGQSNDDDFYDYYKEEAEYEYKYREENGDYYDDPFDDDEKTYSQSSSKASGGDSSYESSGYRNTSYKNYSSSSQSSSYGSSGSSAGNSYKKTSSSQNSQKSSQNSQNSSRSNFRSRITQEDIDRSLRVFGMKFPYTSAQLRKKRNELIRINHPDHGGSNEKAIEINTAYDILKNFVS